MKLILSLIFAFSAVTAFANDGTSELTVWPEYGSYESTSIWQNGNKIGGQCGVNCRNSTIHLEVTRNEGVTHVKGYANDGFTDLTCDANKCEGQVFSRTVDLTLKNGGTEFKGSVNFVYVEATNSADKIRVSADGSLELKKTKKGEWQGSGSLNRDPRSYFGNARLVSTGTLEQLDPALFVVYVISPFVHKGL